MNKSERALDHLLLGIADLDQGIEWVRRKTGISATMGGSHPGVGTRNALFSLGNRQYIEIISIDPMQQETSPRADLVRGLKTPRLITWAAATPDIDSIKRLAVHSGYSVEGPSDGSRVKTDGTRLKWKTLSLQNDFDGVIPFFIEWDSGTVHPSVGSPSGCRLEELEIRHPDAEQVREILKKLGIVAVVVKRDKPRLSAVLSAPKGRIQIF